MLSPLWMASPYYNCLFENANLFHEVCMKAINLSVSVSLLFFSLAQQENCSLFQPSIASFSTKAHLDFRDGWHALNEATVAHNF